MVLDFHQNISCARLSFFALGGKVSSNCPLKKVTLDPCQTKVSVGHGCCPNDTGFTGSVKMEWVTCGPWKEHSTALYWGDAFLRTAWDTFITTRHVISVFCVSLTLPSGCNHEIDMGKVMKNIFSSLLSEKKKKEQNHSFSQDKSRTYHIPSLRGKVSNQTVSVFKLFAAQPRRQWTQGSSIWCHSMPV